MRASSAARQGTVATSSQIGLGIDAQLADLLGGRFELDHEDPVDRARERELRGHALLDVLHEVVAVNVDLGVDRRVDAELHRVALLEAQLHHRVAVQNRVVGRVRRLPAGADDHDHHGDDDRDRGAEQRVARTGAHAVYPAARPAWAIRSAILRLASSIISPSNTAAPWPSRWAAS